MTKLEKIEKLNSVLETIKSEFIGLDDIIDEIGKSILPWYVTPEVIKRPVIVSLWGMTGTGKTSVVNRLIELLDLGNKSISFDCGAESTDGKTAYNSNFADKLSDIFNGDSDESQVCNDNLTSDLVFILDEFQHARTLDEAGCEVSKSNFRPVWELIDSGIINLSTKNGYWEMPALISFIEDLTEFVKDHPGIEAKSGWITSKESINVILNSLGYFYYDRGVPEMTSEVGNNDSKYSDIRGGDFRPLPDEELYRPLNVIMKYNRLVFKKLDSGIERLRNCNTIEDCLELLIEVRDLLLTPKKINCSKSLVFIIGNLDEAFKVGSNVDPDIDADIFHDITSKVSVSDIKSSLSFRFRAEQIARFGNNIIKYPTLGSEDFKKIIKQEVSRVCDEFRADEGLIINVSDRFLGLIYSEGVYPVQGTRPVYTTIGSIFTPLLSDIVIYRSSHQTDVTSVIIDVDSENYRVPEINIILRYNDGFDEYKPLKLTLGSLRNPMTRKTRYCTSIHEAGHAIALTYYTGVFPTEIVSVSVDRGGFCASYDKDRFTEIRRKIDIDNEVRVAIAGYIAEKSIFDDEMSLMGSSSDLENAWNTFAKNVYDCGYYAAIRLGNHKTASDTGVPRGVDVGIESKIASTFEEFEDEVTDLIKTNSKLLVKVALELGETGRMSGDRFKELVSEVSEKGDLILNSSRVQEISEKLSDEYYINILKKF